MRLHTKVCCLLNGIFLAKIWFFYNLLIIKNRRRIASIKRIRYWSFKNRKNFITIWDSYICYTENNTVKAKYVELASHYPFINFPGVYFAKMYQSSSYVIGIDTKSELFDGMYINIQSPIYSFRTAKDGNKKSLLLFMMCLFYYFTTFENKLIEII